MKLTSYLKDKIFSILIFLFICCLIILLLIAFKSKTELIICIIILLIFSFILTILIDYFRKKNYYETLQNHIKEIDKAYLVLETITKPNFYEGFLQYEMLYDINKSMIENVKNYEIQVNNYKDYIEMWIHEVKIPLSALILMSHNHKEKFPKDALKQIKKIDDYLEQILYYTRSENASKDYCISKVKLKKCVNSVALRNKDYLLESNIEFIVNNIDSEVYTDSKWLEFILNQIISNSIKYKDDKKESYIKISTINAEETITLIIEDNGIGITESDLKRVFEKTFTGSNGRNNYNSTGMGLFIVKNLCDKLGHTIKIESKQEEYTKILLTFSKNNYYDVID